MFAAKTDDVLMEMNVGSITKVGGMVVTGLKDRTALIDSFLIMLMLGDKL